MRGIAAFFLASIVFIVSLTWNVFDVKAQNACKNEIYQVDTGFSTVTVKSITDTVAESYELIIYYVTDETKIIKDGNEITMRQLFPGDKVCVETKIDEQGNLIAALIRVTHDF
jgi:hypothetical protein